MPQLLHRTFFLPGPAGRLEALLWDVPDRDDIARPPLAAVVCHPHPLFDFFASKYPGTPLLLAGFSFGSWVGLRAGCKDSRVADLIGLGLPVGNLANQEFSYLEACEKPTLLVSGELDAYGPPEKLQAIVEKFPSHAKKWTGVVIIPGADHFFAGHLPEVDRAISAWLKAQRQDLVEQVA